MGLRVHLHGLYTERERGRERKRHTETLTLEEVARVEVLVGLNAVAVDADGQVLGHLAPLHSADAHPLKLVGKVNQVLFVVVCV